MFRGALIALIVALCCLCANAQYAEILRYSGTTCTSANLQFVDFYQLNDCLSKIPLTNQSQKAVVSATNPSVLQVSTFNNVKCIGGSGTSVDEYPYNSCGLVDGVAVASYTTSSMTPPAGISGPSTVQSYFGGSCAGNPSTPLYRTITSNKCMDTTSDEEGPMSMTTTCNAVQSTVTIYYSSASCDASGLDYDTFDTPLGCNNGIVTECINFSGTPTTSTSTTGSANATTTSASTTGSANATTTSASTTGSANTTTTSASTTGSSNATTTSASTTGSSNATTTSASTTGSNDTISSSTSTTGASNTTSTTGSANATISSSTSTGPSNDTTSSTGSATIAVASTGDSSTSATTSSNATVTTATPVATSTSTTATPVTTSTSTTATPATSTTAGTSAAPSTSSVPSSTTSTNSSSTGAATTTPTVTPTPVPTTPPTTPPTNPPTTRPTTPPATSGPTQTSASNVIAPALLLVTISAALMVVC